MNLLPSCVWWRTPQALKNPVFAGVQDLLKRRADVVFSPQLSTTQADFRLLALTPELEALLKAGQRCDNLNARHPDRYQLLYFLFNRSYVTHFKSL